MRRTVEGNRRVGGVPRSAHLSGDAADFVPTEGQGMGALAAMLGRVYPGARILRESDHAHVQRRGWNLPYYGKRGAQGAR